MTISSTASKALGLGNGVTTAFTYAFKIPDANSIRVTYTNLAGTQTVLAPGAYTVSGLGTEAGGTVTYPLSGSPIAIGTTLLIERVVPMTQVTSLENQGGYYPRVVEAALDRLEMQIQQLANGGSNYALALKFPSQDISPVTTMSVASTRAGKYLGFDASGNPLFVPGTALGTDLSAYSALATDGDFAASLAARFATVLNAKLDFGCTGDGVTDDTDEMLAFFTACIANNRPGFIPAGTYVIKEGYLYFDNNFVDTPWPCIDTAGHLAVTFKAAGFANAPFISLVNGNATSGVGKYWRGGRLGGITFLDATGAAASNRHAIKLRGVWGTDFGWIKGTNIRGDLVHIEAALFGGTNPDPYAVSVCRFDGLEANFCVGTALNNQNYVGFTGNVLNVVRAIQCANGIIGLGGNNEYHILSMANISPGWCIDDRTTNTGGLSNRNWIGPSEFDNCENGLRLIFTRECEFWGLRFVHRFQTTPNAAANYWPRAAVDLASAGAPNLTMNRIRVWHRVEAGGVRANLGTFVDAHSNANLTNFDIDQTISDNGALGIVDADLTTGMNANTAMVVRRDNRPIFDSRSKVAALVTSNTAQTVPNAGYGTTAAKMVMVAERYDKDGNYDLANSRYTVPYDGLYEVHALFHINVAGGTRVRHGVWYDRAGLLAALEKTSWAQGGGVEAFELHGLVDLVKGDVVYVLFDQNTGGAVALASPISNAANNMFSIRAVSVG